MDASRLKSAARRCRLGALALTLPVLAACSTAPDAASTSPAEDTVPSQSVESQPAEVGTGSTWAAAQIAGESFEFSPTTCLVEEEDVVVRGPGSNTDTGQVAFLDVDLTGHEGRFVGGVDIDLGTDQPFAAPEDFYRLDPLVDDSGFTLSVENQSVSVGGSFRAHGGAPLPDGPAAGGVVEVRCDAG